MRESVGRQPRRIPINFTLIIGLFFAGGGGAALAAALVDARRALQSAEWPLIEGEIEETGVVTDFSGRGRLYAPLVRYHYRIGDLQYLSDRIAFGGLIETSFRWPAEDIAKRYERRRTVPVSVCPDDPHLAVLEPGMHWSCWIMIAVATVITAVGLGLLRSQLGLGDR